jgi:hypothetical protein
MLIHIQPKSGSGKVSCVCVEYHGKALREGSGGAERSRDREGWRGGDHARGEKDLWAEEVARRGVVRWVAVVLGVGGAGKKRSWGRWRSRKGPGFSIPCRELWEHLTTIREGWLSYI